MKGKMATHKVVGIVTIAVAFAVVLATVVTASPPVPALTSTSGITTVTNIECHGTVKETSSYQSTMSSGNINNTLENGERVGQIQYESTMNAVDGFIQYSKDFTSDGSSAPNLAVERRIGYVADASSGISWLDSTENVGMTIVSEGDSNRAGSDAGALCAFAQDACIPASCVDVSAGSQLSRVKLVSASTKTSVSVTELPRLHHEITAEGIEGIGAYVDSVLGPEGTVDGPYGVGTVSAGMRMSSTEGRGCNYTNAGGEYYPQAGRMTYDEMTSASGKWTFSKSMTYQSQIPPRQWSVPPTPGPEPPEPT